MYEHNIITDAYYLINKFNANGKQVTNMQIQKLMYFFEAYYMIIHDGEEKLYECNFNAWAFGPVAIPLYKEFRSFGNNAIVLTDKNIEESNCIPKEKKELLDTIYDAFENKTAIELVEYTHRPDSPWSKVWKENGEKVGYGANTYIDKMETKEWFKDVFIKT